MRSLHSNNMAINVTHCIQRIVFSGEAQADLTGKRLKALGLRYDIISHSTMVRAVQTAGIIHRYFPNVTMVPDDILREGGPVPPNPTISYWSLPKEVSSYYNYRGNGYTSYSTRLRRPQNSQGRDRVLYY